MKVGLRNRRIFVTPIAWDERPWLYAQFDDPAFYPLYGYAAPRGAQIRDQHDAGNLVVGVIRTADERIGYVVLFPPTDQLDAWEFCYAIPNPKHRNAFWAIAASDAALCYMFDHLKVEAVAWRTRKDNRAALAIIRRIGYATDSEGEVDGQTYLFTRLDRSGWDRRKARLRQGDLRTLSRDELLALVG